MRSHRLALTVVLGLILAAVVAAPTAAAPVKFRITLTPSPMSFGSVPVGQKSAAQMLYVTNRSAMPLQFDTGYIRSHAGTVDIAFAQAPTGCFDGTHIVVGPGQTCGLYSLAFTPNAVGAFYADISVTFTDGVSTVTATSTAKGKAV